MPNGPEPDHVRLVDSDTGENLVFVNCEVSCPRVVESLLRARRRERRRVVDAGISRADLIVNRAVDGTLGVRLDVRLNGSRRSYPADDAGTRQLLALDESDFLAAFDAACGLLETAVAEATGRPAIASEASLRHLVRSFRRVASK